MPIEPERRIRRLIDSLHFMLVQPCDCPPRTPGAGTPLCVLCRTSNGYYTAAACALEWAIGEAKGKGPDGPEDDGMNEKILQDERLQAYVSRWIAAGRPGLKT